MAAPVPQCTYLACSIMVHNGYAKSLQNNLDCCQVPHALCQAKTAP